MNINDDEFFKFFIKNLRERVMEKGGIGWLSEKTNLGRESLYKTLSGKVDIKLKTLISILKALNLKFYIE